VTTPDVPVRGVVAAEEGPAAGGFPGGGFPLRALVVVASNRAAAGVYADRGGPVLVEGLRGLGFEVDGQALPCVDRSYRIGQAIQDRQIDRIEQKREFDHLLHVGHAEIRVAAHESVIQVSENRAKAIRLENLARGKDGLLVWPNISLSSQLCSLSRECI